MVKKKLNDGLRKSQEDSVKKSEAKLLKALEKQKRNTKVNISQLSRDSGISRTQIINKYSYLYDGRANESAKVVALKDEIIELKRKNNIQVKKITELESTNKLLTDKLVELYTVIDEFKKK